MSRLNTTTIRTRVRRGSSPLGTAPVADVRTHEGGVAFAFDLQTELFQLLSGSFVNEDGFYESGADRVERVRELAQKITAADDSEDKIESGKWFLGFVRWLRAEAFIRTGSILLAVEVARARTMERAPGFTREIISAACLRADEPGEILAAWLGTYGKPVPIAVKRGLADAVVRLYNEYSTLRYDTASHGVRFGDVVHVAQPRTNARASVGGQNDALLRHLIDRRHSYNDSAIPVSLQMLRARAALDAIPVEIRRTVLRMEPHRIKAAGMSWESLAGWLQGPMDAEAWETIIPSMGYMALLRNLRNFDEAEVSDEVKAVVAARLSDPEQVAKSMQLPFRFWSAYRSVSNDIWRVPLGQALSLSTQNIPDSLSGRTAVFVDTSFSMQTKLSEKGSVSFQEVGGLFAIAMAMKFGVGNVDLIEFATNSQPFRLQKGASVLDQVRRFNDTNGRVGMGTDIDRAVAQYYKGQDRVVVVSDMQVLNGWAKRATDIVPSTVPFYSFHLGGYATTIANGENRFALGGLSDKTFAWMATIERGLHNGWPWETSA